MVYCSVYGCESNNNNRLSRNKYDVLEITRFYRFPRDKHIQKIWIHKCGQRDVNVHRAFVCSKHFLKYDFHRNYHQYSPKMLRTDAVPTENLPYPDVHKEGHDRKDRGKRYDRSDRRDPTPRYRESSEVIIMENRDDISVHSVPDSIEDIKIHVPVVHRTLTEDKSTSTEGLRDSATAKDREKLEKLVTENKRLKSENYDLKDENRVLCKIFSPGQRQKLRRPDRIIWTNEDLSQAHAIYAGGPEAYRILLKKNYPFPEISTLRFLYPRYSRSDRSYSRG